MTAREIAHRLRQAGIENAAGEARLLIGHFTDTPDYRILSEPDADYKEPALAEAVEKRASRYPLQYLLGEWEFWGMPFRVTPDCLIPRADTEVVAEAAGRILLDRSPKGEGTVFLDLCTGSGCIAAAILAQAPGTKGFAVELIPETARLAEENLRSLGFADRCTVITGDAGAPLPGGGKFDVIVSNPPYIAESEMPDLEPELSFEPRCALTDGGDGLELYRRILAAYADRLTEGGAMIFEHGWRQGDEIARLAAEYGFSVLPIRDYGGNLRGAVLRRNP